MHALFKHAITSIYRRHIILPSVHALGYRLCSLNIATFVTTRFSGDGARWVHEHGIPLLLRAPSSCNTIIMSSKGVKVCPHQHSAQCTSPSPGACCCCCCCCFTSTGAWFVTSNKQHGERADHGIGAMVMNRMVAHHV